MSHTKDVLSVAFSANNRQIVSAARDHTTKLWNTLGVCKYTIQVGCSKFLKKEVHLCTITAFTHGGAKAIDCMDVFWVGGWRRGEGGQ